MVARRQQGQKVADDVVVMMDGPERMFGEEGVEQDIIGAGL